MYMNGDIHLTIVVWKTGMHWLVSVGLLFTINNQNCDNLEHGT